jgi:cytochrome P450
MAEIDEMWFFRTFMMLGELMPMNDQQETVQKTFTDVSVFPPMERVTLVGDRKDVMSMGSKGSAFSVDGAVNFGGERPLIPLGIDPPDHTQYRRLLDGLFSPKRLDTLQDGITAQANAIIDAFVDAGQVNFTTDFAVLFPSSVFCELMGWPQSDRDVLIKLKNDCFQPGAGKVTDPEEVAKIQRSGAREIYAYFSAAIEERKKKPGDDLVSGLLAADFDGRSLNHDEILDISYTLVLGGLDTVTATLTQFWLYLAHNPGHRERIVNDPEVIPKAVEELLRWVTPAPYLFRRASRETEIGGWPDRQGRFRHRQHRPGQPGPRRVPGPVHRRLRPPRGPAHHLRPRQPPLPRLTLGASGAADRAARMAPAHPQLQDRTGQQRRSHPAARAAGHRQSAARLVAVPPTC